jgi:hypothetical protein
MLIPRRYNDVIKCPGKHFSYQSIERHAPLRLQNADSIGFMTAADAKLDLHDSTFVILVCLSK